jgi:hypothetical protein
MRTSLALAVSEEPDDVQVDATQPARLYPRIRTEIAKLAREVDAVKRGAGFTEMLDTMSRFWEYSPFNVWIIRMQMRNATRVAGRRTWEKLGRKVIPGSRPIIIFAPAKLTPPFMPVAVYDVSQTTGRRLPRLDLALHGPTDIAAGLERAVSKLGIRLERFDGTPGAQGYSCGGTIYIRRHLPGLERAATIAHELAHEILHDMRSRGELPPHHRETEADATSYVVLRVLGLPSKAPAYIAWHGGDGKLVLQSLKRVQRTARRILRAYESPGTGANPA